MKIAFFLVGLFGLVLSDDVVFSCISSIGNFRYRVVEDDDGPLIVFGDIADNLKAVYCLQFNGMYEANDYNKTICEPTAILPTIIDFRNLTYQYKNSSNCSTFEIITTTDKGVGIKFIFGVETVDGNNAFKYTFILDNYVFNSTDENAKLILSVTPQKCDDVYDIDSDEGPDNDDDEDEDEDGVRRLEEDSDDRSEIGISSDDSDDFDLDALIFRNTPTATAVCGVDAPEQTISVSMCYSDEEEGLLLAFDKFGNIDNDGCRVVQDPFAVIDKSKFNTSSITTTSTLSTLASSTSTSSTSTSSTSMSPTPDMDSKSTTVNPNSQSTTANPNIKRPASNTDSIKVYKLISLAFLTVIMYF